MARPRSPEALPVPVDRRRIFILPTGFGLFFGAVVLAMLMGGLNYNNNPALLLTFILAAAVHNSFVRAHLNLSGLRLDAVHAEPVHAGQPLRLRWVFQATGHRPRPGLVLDGQSDFALEPGARGEVATVLTPNRRGMLDVPRTRLSTRHPLGFAEAWCWFWPRQQVLVYPTPEPQAPPLPRDGGEGPRHRIDPAGSEIHHLREYRVGDPLRQVSWKSSARSDRLLVREMETGSGTDVRLDFHELHHLPTEKRIQRLTRWVLEAERTGLRYTLVLPTDRMGPGSGPAHRHQCLRALALLPHG